MKGHRRLRRVGTAAAAAVLVLAALPARGSATQTSVEQTAAFGNGTAKALAKIGRFSPGVGNLELGIGTGAAIAEIKNEVAQAQSSALDFGLIGIAITAEDCEGNQPVKPEQLPHATFADNRGGDHEVIEDERAFGLTYGGGRKEAKATTQPLSRAVVTAAPAELGPVATIGGGRAESVAEVIPGVARQAKATVDADLDIAGVVQLHGMHWEALHRTGEGATTNGFFTVESSSQGGVPLDLSALDPGQEAINAALAPSGISVELPRVVELHDPVELLRVTPLRIIMIDSPLGAAVLKPGLELTREQRAQLFDTLTAQVCRLASLLLVGDLTLSAVAGTGYLAIDVGGVEVTSADPALPVSFGAPAATPGGSTEEGGVLATGPGAVVQAPGTAAAAADATQARSVIDRLCESVHAYKSPACSRGAAALLGFLGLLATLSVAALDWRHQQRSRRLRPDEATP